MIPLAVSVGDRRVTSRIDDLTFSRGLHGDAEASFKLADRHGDVFAPFASVRVHDQTGDPVWEGRLEDPGRAVDTDGSGWDMSAIGEVARAADHSAAVVYIDNAYDAWRRDDTAPDLQAPSASTEVGSFPDTGSECLFMQFNPGQPIDLNSQARMVYDAFVGTGMEIGAFRFTSKGGQVSPDLKMEVIRPGLVFFVRDQTTSPLTTELYNPTDMSAAAGQMLESIAVRLRRSGGATNVNHDLAWIGFGNVKVLGRRVDRNGVALTLPRATHVFAHEVVEDLVGRMLTSYDQAGASIDTTSTYEIDSLVYHDGVTAEQVLADLMTLEPDFYWQVGPDVGNGPTFTWRRWPTHARYTVSMADGMSLPGADAERFNRVVVRWRTPKGATRITARTATVPELDEAGLVRSGFIDLGDEVSSLANANRAGDEFLAEHATPPVSGTVTVARKVYDADEGRFVQPWEIRPGHLVRVRELATDVDDLLEEGRDGRCCFRIVGTSYQTSDNTATLELDAPPRTDQNMLAAQISRRDRKR